MIWWDLISHRVEYLWGLRLQGG